jgi:hypothetical protein
MFYSKRWVGVKKKVALPKAMVILNLEFFLNIGKNQNRLAIKSSEKKDHCLTFFCFFLPHYGKKPNY